MEANEVTSSARARRARRLRAQRVSDGGISVPPLRHRGHLVAGWMEVVLQGGFEINGGHNLTCVTVPWPSWRGPDRHHLRRAASPAPRFKRRGRASVELDGARSCSCCEVRLSALTRR